MLRKTATSNDWTATFKNAGFCDSSLEVTKFRKF